MERKTIGEVISTRRKELGLTQSNLAEKMGVTDKAVSKWERNLSCPDLASIPKLAEVLDLSLEELLNVSSSKPGRGMAQEGLGWLLDLFLLVFALLQGAVIMICVLEDYFVFVNEFLFMLGLGLVCIVLYLFRQRKKS